MRWICLFTAALFPALALAAGSSATINSDSVLVINGQKVFPIALSGPPPPDGKAPSGKNAIEELADAGANFLRTGPGPNGWNARRLQRQQAYLDIAGRFGMYCMPYLREDAGVSNSAGEARLRQILNRFKDSPALGAWKGADEPEWGGIPLPPLRRAYDIIKEVDPRHPVVIIQAPRGTVDSLRAYNEVGNIIGADIYPISYPPGIHSLLTNHDISLVGDYTRLMAKVADGKKPVWMVLQISWSGVLNPGKTLRFPTFPEERFMTYEAIIDGARGLLYFGGNNGKAMTEADKKLGWNWRFWNRVLRPVIEEIGVKSPLYPALVAPESKLPIQVSSGDGIEFCAREASGHLFVLACKRSAGTAKVEFSGRPARIGGGDVLYEPPRTVEAHDGAFSDWFAPFEAHVYRFTLP